MTEIPSSGWNWDAAWTGFCRSDTVDVITTWEMGVCDVDERIGHRWKTSVARDGPSRCEDAVNGVARAVCVGSVLVVTLEEVAARLWSPRTFSWAQLLLTVVSGQKRRRFLAQEVYGGKKRGQVSGHEKHVEVQFGWR